MIFGILTNLIYSLRFERKYASRIFMIYRSNRILRHFDVIDLMSAEELR